MKAKDRWLVRKTQIIPIEMIAVILAIHTFRDKDVLMLIDSGPEGLRGQFAVNG